MARGLYNHGRIVGLDDIVELINRGLKDIDGLRERDGLITYGIPLYASEADAEGNVERPGAVFKALDLDYASQWQGNTDEKGRLIRSYLAVAPWRTIYERSVPSAVDIERLFHQIDLLHFLPETSSPGNRVGSDTIDEAQQRASDLRRIFQAWIPSGRYRPTTIIDSALIPPLFSPSRKVWRTRIELSWIEYPDDEILRGQETPFGGANIEYPETIVKGLTTDLKDRTP